MGVKVKVGWGVSVGGMGVGGTGVGEGNVVGFSVSISVCGDVPQATRHRHKMATSIMKDKRFISSPYR